MSRLRQILAGVLGGIAFALGDMLIDGQIASMVLLSLGVIFLLFGVIRGRRSSHAFRAFVSMIVLYWGYSMCLVGRTTGPGLNTATSGMAFTCFVIYGIWPGFVLLRLWSLRYGVAFLVALFPVAFLLAALVAGTEESLFVRKYRDTGIGPTERWTVSNHWLAYDRDKQRLDGSD